MASRTMTIDSLKQRSIKLYEGITAVFPYEAREEQISTKKMITAYKIKKDYAIHQATLCFVSAGELYVTPYTDIAERSLIALGYRRAKFYVPFSNGDYPKKEVLKWAELKENMITYAIDDFVEDCIDYSKEQNIKYLSAKTLKYCIQIPFVGLPVSDKKGQKCFYPIINIGDAKSKIYEYIGRYYMKNNVVVFVYCNGRTYVTKGKEIIKELQASGYQEKEMAVPLSEGEVIQIKTIQKQWEFIVAR